MSVSRLFLLLLAVTFFLVVVFATGITYQFAKFPAEGARLTQNLTDTSRLNQDLRSAITEQISLLRQQFDHLDPEFRTTFGALNFKLSEKQIRYLKLDIGEQERLTVEKIKSLQAELAVQAMQVFEFLRNKNRAQATGRFISVEELEKEIDKGFNELNELQTSKLVAVQTQLNNSVSAAYTAIGV